MGSRRHIKLHDQHNTANSGDKERKQKKYCGSQEGVWEQVFVYCFMAYFKREVNRGYTIFKFRLGRETQVELQKPPLT